jgi:hypothetical protein
LTLLAGSGRKTASRKPLDRAAKTIISHALSRQRICPSGFLASLSPLLRGAGKKESGESAAPPTEENLKFHSELRGARRFGPARFRR